MDERYQQNVCREDELNYLLYLRKGSKSEVNNLLMWLRTEVRCKHLCEVVKGIGKAIEKREYVAKWFTYEKQLPK